MPKFKVPKTKKSFKKWYIITIKGFCFPFWLFPLLPFAMLEKAYKDWSYRRLLWTDEKATKVLNKTLSHILEWVEEDNAFYYSMDWQPSHFCIYAPTFSKKWVRKFKYDLQRFLKEKYENPDYIKEIEVDKYQDVWIKFSPKPLDK